MPFNTGDSFKDIILDTVEGGVSAFGGIYVFDKFLATPLQNALKMAGKYTLPVAGLVTGLALDYAGKKVGGSEAVSEGLRVAGYAAFGKSIATFLGDPTPNMAVASSSKESWGSLTSHPLTFGAEVSY